MPDPEITDEIRRRLLRLVNEHQLGIMLDRALLEGLPDWYTRMVGEVLMEKRKARGE